MFFTRPPCSSFRGQSYITDGSGWTEGRPRSLCGSLNPGTSCQLLLLDRLMSTFSNEDWTRVGLKCIPTLFSDSVSPHTPILWLLHGFSAITAFCYQFIELNSLCVHTCANSLWISRFGFTCYPLNVVAPFQIESTVHHILTRKHFSRAVHSYHWTITIQQASESIRLFQFLRCQSRPRKFVQFPVLYRYCRTFALKRLIEAPFTKIMLL